MIIKIPVLYNLSSIYAGFKEVCQRDLFLTIVASCVIILTVLAIKSKPISSEEYANVETMKLLSINCHLGANYPDSCSWFNLSFEEGIHRNIHVTGEPKQEKKLRLLSRTYRDNLPMDVPRDVVLGSKERFENYIRNKLEVR